MTAAEPDHATIQTRLVLYLSSVVSIVVAHLFRVTTQLICGMRASEVILTFFNLILLNDVFAYTNIYWMYSESMLA